MMEVVDGPVEDNMEQITKGVILEKRQEIDNKGKLITFLKWLYVVASISTYATQTMLVLLGGAMVVMGEIEQDKKRRCCNCGGSSKFINWISLDCTHSFF